MDASPLQRAIDECARIDARFQAEASEIRSQRRAALESILPPSTFRTYDRAVAAALKAYDKKTAAVAERLRRAEAAAPTLQADGERAAETVWQTAVARAGARRVTAIADASRDYEISFMTAARLATAAGGARLSAARAKRDTEIAKAEQQHRAEVDDAWLTYQSARIAAQDKAIAHVEEARREEAAAMMEAATIRNELLRSAEESLDEALAAEPLAAPVMEAFALRLADAAATCAAAKTAVLAQV